MITPKKDNYFDNETILYQFRRLFTLFKYCEVLKASKFEIDLLVDNATTHTKVEIDVNLFAKGVNHSTPVEFLLWTDKNGIDRVTDCYFRDGENAGKSKGLFNLCKELGIIEENIQPKDILLKNLRELAKNHQVKVRNTGERI